MLLFEDTENWSHFATYSPGVLFKTCISMKFVDDDDDDTIIMQQITFSEHEMHTRVWTVVTCSYLLQLSFKLDLSPSPHHHFWVRDAAREAGVWRSLIQALGNVLLVAQLLSLCFFLALLQFLLLAF